MLESFDVMLTPTFDLENWTAYQIMRMSLNILNLKFPKSRFG